MTVITSGTWPISAPVTSGTELATYLNELVNGVQTSQASPTRPPALQKGGVWAKTLGAADIALMFYDGTTDREIGSTVSNNWTKKGSIISVGNQGDNTEYSTTSTTPVTATRFQITPSSPTSRLIGWFFCQVRASNTASSGDWGSTVRTYFFNNSGTWVATSALSQLLHFSSLSGTGTQEVSATFPFTLDQSSLNASGVWDVAIRHFEVYTSTSIVDDGRIHYMEYEP